MGGTGGSWVGSLVMVGSWIGSLIVRLEMEPGSGANEGGTGDSWVGEDVSDVTVASGPVSPAVDSTVMLERSSVHFLNSVGDNLCKRVAPDSNDVIRTETSFREAISLGLQNFSSGQPSRMTWYFSVMKRSKFV